MRKAYVLEKHSRVGSRIHSWGQQRRCEPAAGTASQFLMHTRPGCLEKQARAISEDKEGEGWGGQDKAEAELREMLGTGAEERPLNVINNARLIFKRVNCSRTLVFSAADANRCELLMLLILAQYTGQTADLKIAVKGLWFSQFFF